MIRLVMKNYYMTLTEKRQKISSLSSGKIDKYEYLIGKKILLKIILFFCYLKLNTWKRTQNITS